MDRPLAPRLNSSLEMRVLVGFSCADLATEHGFLLKNSDIYSLVSLKHDLDVRTELIMVCRPTLNK